jgi:maltose alpha-D-glucosyltransferase/alpha-amylase
MAQVRSAFPLADDPLWYKDAIIYEVPVKAFFDSNNDGIGDFPGLIHKLDYIQDLGANAVWLLPFYPSPMRDDGYDIADYHQVAPEYGTRHDFRSFVREAHRRGLRVITELVINHTSDQHPWFQAARRAPKGSVKRDYYVWSDSDKKYAGTRIIFTDTESSNWAWDPLAQAYYWHRFFSHQPDLNFNSPRVVKAVMRVMRFWLDLGVDGMRLDAIPYLCEREGTINENLPETHEVIKYMRRQLDAHYRNCMLLAEANQWPEDVREYFGDGDECHMAYHFPLMPRIYMAVAQEDRHPIVEIMQQTPDIPDNCQWAIFLRNHDELTLEMVTDRERDYMYRMYATDPRARLNLGIRRRLAPLMDNDRAKIQLVTWILMTMPGSPILYYGDEIGMGDNIYLGDRNGVRTPMQWSPDRNAGFSRCDPQRLYLPPVMDPIYGYEAVNVEAQVRNPWSLLNWTKRVIGVRKSFRAFGRGTLQFLRPGNRKILAYIRSYGDEVMLCVANLCRSPQAVELDLAAYRGRVPVELTGRNAFPPVGERPYLVTLPGYGFYLFQLDTDIDVPYWHEEIMPRAELPLLVLLEGWRTFLQARTAANDVRRAMASRTRDQLQREVLGPYLATKRWFAAKGHAVQRIDIVEDGEWRAHDGSWLLAFAHVECRDLAPQTYFLPMSIAWGEDEERLRGIGSWIIARVRQKANMGVLYGAFGDDVFCRALVVAMGEAREFPLGGGTLRFWRTSAYGSLVRDPSAPIRRPSLEQSNIGLFIGDQLYLKAYPKVEEGINPEAEMGRFLTESSFTHVAPVVGGLDYVRKDGAVVNLVLVQGMRENQGNGWNFTLDYLQRVFESALAQQAPEGPPAEATHHAAYLALMRTLGRRTAELHQVLCAGSSAQAFAPEPVREEDVHAWTQRVSADAVRTLDQLEAQRDKFEPAVRQAVIELLGLRGSLLDRIMALTPGSIAGLMKTRYHGDYHLSQVLVHQDDFIITDFEGEPARSIAERRAKHSPLRDVAGMLRSFSYAAAVALDQFCATRPNDRTVLGPFANAWERAAARAFLEAYRDTVAGCSAYPRDEADAARLIDLFAIEKALYEIRYEQDNRPVWLPIPVHALIRLIQS